MAGIQIQNQQKAIRIEIRRIRSLASAILAASALSKAEVSILLLDDAGIALLNEQYRKKARPTDVLSFPMHDDSTADIQPQLLGDIVISAETASRQAQQHGVDLYEELAFLLTHGVLHLLGYDHETSPADSRRMRAQQKKIMQSLGFGG